MPDKEPTWISAVRIFFGALAVIFMVGVDYLKLFGEEFPDFVLLLLIPPVFGLLYLIFSHRSDEINPDESEDVAPAERVNRLFEKSESRSGKDDAD